MKTTILILLLVTLVFNSSIAQNKEPIDSLKSMEQLAFMQGSWKGEGWIMKNRERMEFLQEENINFKVDNNLLVIDGIGREKNGATVGEKIIHNAFGVISFDEKQNHFTMLSFSSTGGKMENEIELIAKKKIQWSFKNERGGTIRFTEDFSQDGFWIENGEYSTDGKTWFPFFYMKLEKTNSNEKS